VKKIKRLGKLLIREASIVLKNNKGMESEKGKGVAKTAL